jgi:Branched-chain amino acid transport protein (AzlD)
MSGILATLEHASGGLWPYFAVLIFGFLPSEIWRWLSVFLVRGLSEESEILVWVRAVASALLASVVAKLLLSPSGALAVVPPLWRWAALASGCLAYFLAGRRMMIGVVVAEAAIIAAGYAYS